MHTHHTLQSVNTSTSTRLSVTVTWNRWCQHWLLASLSTAETSTTRPLWWWPVAMDDSMWLGSFWRGGKDSFVVQCWRLYSGTSLLWTPLGPHKVSWLKRCPYFQRLFCMLLCVAETAGSVLIREVSLFRRLLIERFHCSCDLQYRDSKILP